jgi:hypothetical protein
MSQNALPEWVQYAQAFAAPLLALVIAAVGTWIASRQMQIARVKLRHDLYDRRFAVFQAARKLLAEALTTRGNVTDDQVRAYVVGTSDSVFLLDEEISTYLEEIRKAVTRLQTIRYTLEPLPVGEERSALVKQEEQIFSRLMTALPAGLVTKFKPFLTLDTRKRAERRSWFMPLDAPTVRRLLKLPGRCRR